ncbi:MAG: cob(I)yrinic acid a,c-diamide adenosyltransferase [Dehalococcoidales bacterium]|nr:cob(I)yrinic acid a,c-diamide adenosyltransferase [Dehalococcoidales bacterium]
MVQIYTGEGKGKTTAAIGNIIRALGHGSKVYVAVFMKGDYTYGEWDYLTGLPNVKIERFGLRDFCNPDNIKPEEKEQAEKALTAAREAISRGIYDLVVLDEINIAIAWHLIDINDVIKLIDAKPTNLNLILTGRYADSELVKKADLVTEMLKIKHHYDTGISAQQGIEF